MNLQQALSHATSELLGKEALITENFIDGQFVSCANYIDSIDPSTGQPWALIPDSGQTEVNQAVQGAQKAFARSHKPALTYPCSLFQI